MALPAFSTQPIDTLSQARATFVSQTNGSMELNGNGDHIEGAEAESSRDAQARQAEANLKERTKAYSNGENGVDDDWRQELRVLDDISPPKINPFHLLSHPNDSSALPPLPSHLQALASDTGDPNNSNGHALLEETHNSTLYATTSPSPISVEPQIHITKVTKDTVHIVAGSAANASEMTKPKRMMKKVGNVFKRDANGGGIKTADGVAAQISPNGHSQMNGIQRSPVLMQGPPPSPPISDNELVESEESHAASTSRSEVTETTIERTTVEEGEINDKSLTPVVELTETRSTTSETGTKPNPPLIYTSNLTAEPADLATSSPINITPSQLSSTHRSPSANLSLPSRRTSVGSTSSRTGSLAVVRSGRMAPQRGMSTTSLDKSSTDHTGQNGGTVPEPNHGTYTGALGAALGLGLGPGKELPALPASSVVLEEWEKPSAPGMRQSSQSSSTGSSPTNIVNPTLLHPSSAATTSLNPQPRIARRSTNPSPMSTTTPLTIPRSPLIHSQSTYHSPSLKSRTSVPGLDGAALDSDILAQAETIRRERLERRQKKMSASASTDNNAIPDGEIKEKNENLMVPNVVAREREPKRERTTDEQKVLVGNLIGEDHVNYVLMYNMLTGIRIGVSRCQAKIKRPLTDEDYLARHKFSFDVVGNELTPSARYDFKFKDYAPWIFRDLRDEHFHLDPADYLLSLTAKYILSELGSPGKSGSFFYFSRDYRFIIKTISHSEHKFLRSILKDYHDHIKTNPHTLLSRFYGLHRVKLPRGRKIHFVIMNNLFPPHRDIHETFDLKGSAYGREYPEDKALKNPRAVLKDKNWVNRARTLELGPEKRALLSEQLRRDMEFLKKMRVMDYSLLVGIHNMERGNRDNLRENSLTVFHPEMPVRRKPSAVKPSSDASNVRKAIRRSDPKMLDAASQLPLADSSDRRHFLFYQDEGGLRATDEANQNMDVIYYLGVIDICTPYNLTKRLEHFWKSMTEDRHTISAVDPGFYGQRFLNFLLSVMRGGDPSLRPVGLQPIPPNPDEKPVGEVGPEILPGEGQGAELGHDVVNTEQGPAIVGHLKAE